MSAATESKKGTEPDALGLIEEATHLLREASASTWAIYYAGAAPFAVGIVYLWARLTWFRPSGAVIAWLTLGMVFLFVVMKTAQAEFCARLLAQRLGQPPPRRTARDWLRLAHDQFCLHAAGLLALPLALLIAAPFGWVYAYYQSASALGTGNDLADRARRQALLWPMQNHIGITLLTLVGLAAWLNIGLTAIVGPQLANRLLGIQNVFGFAGMFFLNTTFIASTFALAWLALDPLVKAFYTLRVFYGQARRTGEDLQVELVTTTASRRLGRIATTLVLTVTAFATLPKAQGQPVNPATPEASAPAVNPADFSRTAREVLAGSDFDWRLRRPPGLEADTRPEGPMTAFVRTALDGIGNTLRSLYHKAAKAIRWVRDLFPRGRETGPNSSGGGLVAVLEVWLWIAAVIGAGLLIGGLVIAWRRNRASRPVVTQAVPVATATPDLHDERTQAAQLPVAGWLELARQQLANGNLRLAWRALYLATLARLAAEGCVALAQFKTNLDYERELRRRVAHRVGLISWFSNRRRGFEDVWYGRGEATAEHAHTWLAELERPDTP